MKCTIKWITKKQSTIDKICGRFDIEYHPTINGHSRVEIRDEDVELFHRTRDCGHFTILAE